MEFDENGRIFVVEDRGYPLSVMRWKKGILVTDAPDLLYFEDSDGDGKADIRRVVLTGFAVTNPQHTVNNPVYGLDNWIYIAHENPANSKRNSAAGIRTSAFPIIPKLRS